MRDNHCLLRRQKLQIFTIFFWILCYKLHWHQGEQGLLSLRTLGKKRISVFILEYILRDVFNDKVRRSLIFGRTSSSLIPSMSHLLCVSYDDLSLPLTLCPFLCSGWNAQQCVEQNLVVNQGVWAVPMGISHNLNAPFQHCWLETFLGEGNGAEREIPIGMRRRKVMQILLYPNCDLDVQWEQEDTKVRSLDTDRSQRWSGPQRGLRRAVWIWPILQIITCLPFVWNNVITIRLFWCCSHCLQSHELVFPWAFPTLWWLLLSALPLWKKYCGPMISDRCYNAIENYTLPQVFIPVDLYI